MLGSCEDTVQPGRHAVNTNGGEHGRREVFVAPRLKKRGHGCTRRLRSTNSGELPARMLPLSCADIGRGRWASRRGHERHCARSTRSIRPKKPWATALIDAFDPTDSGERIRGRLLWLTVHAPGWRPRPMASALDGCVHEMPPHLI